MQKTGVAPPKRRWARFLVGPLALLLVLIAVVAAVFYTEASAWPDLEDTEPMVPDPPGLPNDDLAWSHLQAAMHAADPDWDGREAFQVDGPHPDWETSGWEINEAAQPHLDAALARPGLRIPVSASVMDKEPDLRPLFNIVRARLLRGGSRLDSGATAEGLEDLAVGVSLGERLRHVDGGFVGLLWYAVGIAHENYSLGQLHGAIGTGVLDEPELLRRLIEILVTVESRPTGFRRALQCECAAQELLIREAPVPAGAWPMGSPFHDEDAYVAKVRVDCVKMVDAATGPYGSRPSPLEPVWSEDWTSHPGWALHLPSTRVLLYQGLHGMYYGFFTSIAERTDRMLADRRGLILRAALRLHFLETGTLPETLAGLVPGQLEAVPVDPFTGEDFGYDQVNAFQSAGLLLPGMPGAEQTLTHSLQRAACEIACDGDTDCEARCAEGSEGDAPSPPEEEALPEEDLRVLWSAGHGLKVKGKPGVHFELQWEL